MNFLLQTVLHQGLASQQTRVYGVGPGVFVENLDVEEHSRKLSRTSSGMLSPFIPSSYLLWAFVLPATLLSCHCLFGLLVFLGRPSATRAGSLPDTKVLQIEKGTLLHCWWECKLVQPLWKTVWRFLKKLEIELPYDPAIPLLGIHTEETRSERDTCSPMFTAALFIIARTWKQPRCPSADEWTRKLWYIYTMEYYSAV